MERKTEKELDDNSVNSYREEQVFESLHEALDSLPDIYREVLTLHYLGGISSEQIARILSIPYATVRQRLSRARTQLREEILTMVSETYEQQRLKAIFTFRIVEMVKQIKVNPISTMKGLPLGLSLATGFIIAFLGFGTHLNMPSNFDMAISSSLSPESKVLKVGGFPVDVLKVSNIPVISNGSQNTLFMAPQANVGEWVKKADMPTARTQFAGAVVNGKIYAIGGYSFGNIISTVEEYDPTNDEWTEKASMPTKRFSENGAIVIDGLIYVFGGADGNKAISTVEAYDPIKDKWIKKADMPTERTGFFAGVVNGRIYFLGGAGKDNKFVLTVEEYDPTKDIWIKKADMPTGKYTFGGAVVNNKIYTFGGDSSGNVNAWGPAISLVEEYDTATDIWTRKSDLPTPRIGISAVTVDNKIYTIGGFNGLTVYPIVEIYDPSNDTWSKGENLLVPTSAPLSCAVNGKIYVIGGANVNQQLSDVQEYDTGSRPSQTIESKDKLPTKWGELKSR